MILGILVMSRAVPESAMRKAKYASYLPFLIKLFYSTFFITGDPRGAEGFDLEVR
jgi:hypothetical protein